MNHSIYQTPAALQPIHKVVKSKILSIGSYLPKQRVTSDEIMQEIKTDLHYDMPCDWMSQEMGIFERRMVADHLRPSDLAIRAAQRALDECEAIEPNEIDAVIFCGIERDRPEPATAHTIQNALGLKAHHVFDIANACYGFIDGLKLASALIETNMVTNALVVTGEVTTRMSRVVIDMLKKGMPAEDAKHLWGLLSVGDAGGAAILGQSFDGVSGFMAYNQRCDSRHTERCYYEYLADGSVDGKMQMGQVLARGFQLNKVMVEETLEMLGWDAFDWVLSHQTGKRSFDICATLKSLDEDKLVRTYPLLGNITTATFPISFQKLVQSGKVNAGDRIGGVFAGSGLVAGQFGYVF